MDREDRGARKSREAEGEGGGLAGRRKARGREQGWRACASLGKGVEEERAGGSSRRGGSSGAEPARTGAVSSGKRGNKGEPSAPSLWIGEGAARALTRAKNLEPLVL